MPVATAMQAKRGKREKGEESDSLLGEMQLLYLSGDEGDHRWS